MTTREGYREYKSNPKKCTDCPFLSGVQNLETKQKWLPDMFGRSIRKRYELTRSQSPVKYFISLERKK